MTDLFREIEQDLRRERANELWEKYGIYLVGLAIAIVVATASVVGWRAYERSRNQDASLEYQKLVDAASLDSANAATSFEKFAADAPQGYAVLAELRRAAALSAAGDIKAAVDVYDGLAAQTDIPDLMRGLARIKAGLLLIDTASYEDIRARMVPLTQAGDDGAWRYNAREIIGTSALKAGAYADADAEFAAIIAGTSVSPALRDRAHMMKAMIAPLLAPTAKVPQDDAPVAAEPAKTPETK